jgi:putative holliday junction resolvase
MNYLCLDYGEQHVGLAYSAGFLAEPLSTVATHQAIPFIKSIINTYAIDKIIIGLSEGIMAQKTQAFATKLSQVTHLPIVFQDETLTSQETRLRVARMGMKKSRREAKIDHLVAAAILEDYLESNPDV